jgi:hypothetical protein
MRTRFNGKDLNMYGYEIKNGAAVIDQIAAGKIRTLYQNYLSGMTLSRAAKEAGINARHGSVSRILENRHYLGDDFYPPIIDRCTFDLAAEERMRRAHKLGRTKGKSKEKPERIPPTRFHRLPANRSFEDPKQQAEFLYSLIESEV